MLQNIVVFQMRGDDIIPFFSIISRVILLRDK